jgi:ribonuclease Z
MAVPFQVLILGSGSAIPNKNKNHTSQLVLYNSRHLLFDCGEGSQIRMKKFGVSVQKIDHIFISHLHGDHYLGLAGLIFTMNLLGREKKLNIYAPEGLKDVIDLHFKLANSRSAFELCFINTQNKEVQELFNDGSISVSSFPVKHKIPTTGFLIRAGRNKRKLLPEALKKYKIPKHLRAGISEGRDFVDESGHLIKNELITIEPEKKRSYAFCADTSYQPYLSDVLTGVNLMYHEASFSKMDAKRAKEHLHSTAEQAGKLAKASGAGKLLIGHFSNKYGDNEVLLKEARAEFPETYYAEEGCTYDIV